ncbi:MAG: methionine--tRNA ligase subunit beta, partial [Bacteroidales bacterium]|nr:methionine--tRNA ligase subunit beta [Bacteroidales bacterium]
ETKDNDFSWKDFQTRNNSELVAIFGNFVNRAIVLTHKYFDGKVPAAGALEDIDREALAQIPALKESMEKNLENYRFREALRDAMSMARTGNKYISDTEPWKVAKTDMSRCATILNVSLQICADLASAFEPFTPFAAQRLRSMLGDVALDWDAIGRTDIIPAGTSLKPAELLFAKVEDAEIDAQLAKLDEIRKARQAAEAAEAAKKVAPQKEECSFEDFDRMDIRTATVLEAQKVPKTDKLLKLTIDTGIDKRVIVSGIAEYYSPEDMVGRQICILANLKPRVIKGIESKGMILMARQADGKMRFITPQEALVNGSQIG